MEFYGHGTDSRQQGTSNSKANGLTTRQNMHIKPTLRIYKTRPGACAQICRRHLPTTGTEETEEPKSTQANMTGVKDLCVEIEHEFEGLPTPCTPQNKLTTSKKATSTGAPLNEQKRRISFSNSNGHFDPVSFRSTNPVTSSSNGVSCLKWLWPCVVIILAIALVFTNLRVGRLESAVDHLVRTTGCKHEGLPVQSEQIVNIPQKSRETWLSRSTNGRGLIRSFHEGILIRDKFSSKDYVNTVGSRTSVSNKEELGEPVNEDEDFEIKLQQTVTRGRFDQPGMSDISSKLHILYDTLKPTLRTSDTSKSSNSDLSNKQDAECPKVGFEDKKMEFGGLDTQQSRAKRSSAPCRKQNKKYFDQYCQDKWAKKNDKDKYLSSVQFDAEFYKIYDFNKHFIEPKVECFHDETWPTKPKVCKEATLEYPDEDSPIALYYHHHHHDNNNNDSVNNSSTTKPGHRHRQHRQDLVSIHDKAQGVFRVTEPGVYLVHLNITIVDESHNHSLAIFLNGQAVLACPKGGFRCPHSNESKSYKYRICNIDGVLELSKGDNLQVRTLEPKTVIRLESHRKSQLRFILLHPTGKGPKKNKKE